MTLKTSNKNDKEENMLFKEATASFTAFPRLNGECRLVLEMSEKCKRGMMGRVQSVNSNIP